MEEVPAPKKLAPYSAALSAETVETVGATPVATGRFVVLHDPNGQDAWDYLQDLSRKNGPIENHVRIIISDIEMPKMDGHRLLKLVREDNRLGEVPLVLFSSLISEEMKRKGESLGASGQVSKPEINQLIDLIDTLIFGEPLHDVVAEP